MADPIPPVVNPDDNANIAAQNDLVDKAKTGLSEYSTIVSSARDFLSGLNNQFIAMKVNFSDNNRLIQSQTQIMGALTTVALGAKDAFNSLGNVEGLNLFTKQIDDLKEVVLNTSEPLKAAKNALDSYLKTGGTDQGVIGSMRKKIQDVSDAVLGSAMAFARSADNAQKLQNGFIQLSARTGNLDEVFSAAGPNLEKLGFFMQNQAKAIADTGMATNLPREQIEKFYGEIGNIPGALKSVVPSSQDANKNISMLTGAIQYASGSGRTFTDVMGDLKVAFQDYNLVGQDALQFTARMGELSNKFGVELSDVQSSLRNTAENFKMFGNEAEGAARMMNQYLGALEDTGISGHVAMGVVQSMTEGIKGLTIAQKGFLSAQTGGPGGLMGAFQIEKMLREGKLDEVMDKVKATLTKQFGQITTLEEASKSPQAAAQLTKQMMLLKQGPLGSIVKDDQSAMRLLEAMKGAGGGRMVGAAEALSGTVVQDKMNIGVELQKKSNTELSRIRAGIDALRLQAEQSNLGTMQHAFSAGVGIPVGGAGDYNAKMRRQLSGATDRGAFASGSTIENLNTDIAENNLKNRGGQFAVSAVKNFENIFNELEPALQGPIKKIKDLLQSGKGNKAAAEAQNMMGDIARRRAEIEILPQSEQAGALDSVNRDEALAKRALASIPTASSTTSGLSTADLERAAASPEAASELTKKMMVMSGPQGLGGMSDLGVQMKVPGSPAGDQVGLAASRVAGRGPGAANQTGRAGGADLTAMMPNASTVNNGELTVRVEGICLDCHQKALQGASQRLSNVPASIISK